MHRSNRWHHHAGLGIAAFVAIVMAIGLLYPSRSSGATRASATVEPASGAPRAADAGGPGSSRQPITLPGIEITATGRAPAAARDMYDLRFGLRWGRLYRASGRWSLSGTLRSDDGAVPAPESNVYTGAGAEASIVRPAVVYVEGARATLRDPVDVLSWGDDDADHWATSAGLAIHF
jgi:hypothetical protein